MTLLFEKHLEMTTPGVLRGSDTPFADEYRDELAENVTEVLRTFANGLDESADLGTSFDSFCHHYELSEEDAAWIQDVLIETTKLAFGGRRDADDDAIRSFLKTLSQPFPKPTKTPPNQDGMTPRAGEHAIKEFLRKLEVAKHPDPFGNDGYSADKYKAFDREANRYGRNYSYKNDYNNQTPSRPLANPTLNVDTGNKAFEAVDSVGMGVPMHFRVVNKLTNEYVTKPIHKEEALQIASDLNREFEQVLDENNFSTSDVSKALTEASRGPKIFLPCRFKKD